MATESLLWTLRLDDPRSVFVPGSTIVKCSRCNADCNFSPSSNKFIADDPATKIVCLNCMNDDDRRMIFEQMIEQNGFSPTNEQAGEIAAHFNASNN